MTISGITNSSLLPLLTQQTGTSVQSQTAQQSASSYSNSPAYTLALGQQQAEGALLGYSQLGKLVSQTEGALDAIDRDNPATGTARFGNGTPLQRSYSVNVQQLAQAQVLTSGGFSDSSQVIGSGTLTIQGGAYDASADSFSPTGNTVTVSITDGSLSGVAKSINDAKAGITAAVVTGSDGQSHLQLTGISGGDAAFTLSGIPGLAYDPTQPSFTGLEAAQSAQDALYSVDGGAVRSSHSNDNVPIDTGVSATLTATGATTVSAPFGQSQAVGAAQALIAAFNGLISGVGQMTGGGGQLAGDTGVASQLAKALGQVAGQSFQGDGKLSSLADLGITVQSDGTLSLDQGKLQSAYQSDPTGTRSLIDQATKAFQSLLGGTQGTRGQIQSELKTYAQQMIQMPSLIDYLDGSQSTDPSQSSDPFGQSDPSSQLQSLMSQIQSSPGLASALGNSTQGQSLLSSLGLSTGGTGTDSQSLDGSLAQALASQGTSA